MNRLLQTASKSVASSLRINHATPSSSAVQFLKARHFSDSPHNAQRELAARGYIKSTSSLSLNKEDEEYIQQHVDKRAQIRKEYDYVAADKIRDDLAEKFDVNITDKQKLWSIGGLFEELGDKFGKPKGVYTRKCSGDLSAEDEEAISKMILDRYHAKKEKNFDAADEIRDALMLTYSVKVDDRFNEWRVETDDYAMMGENTLSDEDVEYIDSKLKERFILKRDRLYTDADVIRDDLTGRFGVNVNDREKKWSVNPAFGVAVSKKTKVDSAVDKTASI